MRAKQLTLLEPSIIGPTAPVGTDSPWDHHKETIVVRKIAGKTETIPARSDDVVLSPFEMSTHPPIAVAARVPRDASASQETLFLPRGAGGFRIHAHIPIVTIDKVAKVPICKPLTPRFLSASTPRTLPAARADQTQRVMLTITISLVRIFAIGIAGGKVLHANRKNALRSIPTGVMSMAAANKASEGDFAEIPMAAGIMVLGILPKNPPTIPPNRSMARVIRIAASPANKADRITGLSTQSDYSIRALLALSFFYLFWLRLIEELR